MKGLRFSLTTMGTTLSLLALGATNPAESITLTSITLDPENATGQTTNAPGALIIFAYRIVKCLLGKTFRTILWKKLSV